MFVKNIGIWNKEKLKKKLYIHCKKNIEEKKFENRKLNIENFPNPEN